MNKAKVEGNEVVQYPYTEADLKRDNPNTSFPVNPLGNSSIRDAFNIVIVGEAVKPSYNTLSQKLVSGDLQKDGESWSESLVVVDKGNEEREQDLRNQWDSIRLTRDGHLYGSDWTQFNDSPLDGDGKAAWAEYRRELRDIPQTQDDPWNIEWPEQPEV